MIGLKSLFGKRSLSAEEGLKIEADNSLLPRVTDYVESALDEAGCRIKTKMQILMAVEEIFVNICSYAYAPDKGSAIISVKTMEDPKAVVITFTDQGMRYDPLGREDPDVTLSAEKRKIGGLGVFLVKKTMDDVQYRYEDGCNILTIKKYL